MHVKILNIEPDGFSADAEIIIRSHAQYEAQNMSRQDLKKNISKYDVLITRLGHKIDREIMDAGANLKAVVTATTGLNHIDLDYAKERNIKVLCLKGEFDFLKTVTATAEHSFGLLLALSRHIIRAALDARQGHWDRDKFKGH